MNIEKSFFGNTGDGKSTYLYLLENDNDIKVKITNYGGIITHLEVPDRNGIKRDVVLGFDNLEDYLGDHPYFGAIIGRVGNRIKHGKFELGGIQYELAVNNGPNHLHGGLKGFDRQVWSAHTEIMNDSVSLHLAYESPDEEEGYPGNLMVEVTYTLNNNNELIISYRAVTDRDTVLNLTNHSYFNLKGGGSDILGHSLRLDSSFYTPVDEFSIPTGEILSVENTPFDFRKMKKIGTDWDKLENGYDHNYVINRRERKLTWFAEAKEESTGIIMEVATTEPGVQLYTSNYIEEIKAKNNLVYRKNAAFCLETQHFPDSPNNSHFPSVVLKPGEEYKQLTIHRFRIE